MEKVENLDTNSHDKTKYVIHMRNTKQAINHGLAFFKLFSVRANLSCYRQAFSQIIY